VSALLLHAFRALGAAATAEEIASVAKALRKSGDQEVGALLDYVSNRQGWRRCVAMADDAGASGFVALDLAVAYHNPRHFARYVDHEQTSTEEVTNA
jgi:tryptophan synthase alpha subunit